MAQDTTDQDFAQEIASVIREAFAVVNADDLTAQARYDADLGGWAVRHWHLGIRYDLGMCEVGQVPGLWRGDVWVGGMGRLLAADTPRTVAIRMLMLVHGGLQLSDTAHAKAVCGTEVPEAKLTAPASKLTPEQWLAMPKFAAVQILDCDGWTADEWDVPITREEFRRRLSLCTQIHPVWAERTTG